MVLTVKSLEHVGCKHEHEEGVDGNVGVVDISTKEIPFVVDERGHKSVLQQLLTLVVHLHERPGRHKEGIYMKSMLVATCIMFYHMVEWMVLVMVFDWSPRSVSITFLGSGLMVLEVQWDGTVMLASSWLMSRSGLSAGLVDSCLIGKNSSLPLELRNCVCVCAPTKHLL